MLWMEHYLCYCSVRLGVIVIGVLTLLQLLIPAIFFLALGVSVLDPLVELFQNDDHYKKNYFVMKAIDWIENSSQMFMIIMHVYFVLHSAACISAIYGAFRLQKYFLLPFSLLEFMRVFYCLTWHIVLMIVLKKILNLGVLIAFTLMGGFFILYLAYNWACCVALYQIINLIHSDRYIARYGADPFKPISPRSNQFGYGHIENVRVLTTPNARDVDEQKLKNHSQTIIAVLPANYEGQERLPFVGNARRPRQSWRQPLQQPQQVQQHRQQQLQLQHGQQQQQHSPQDQLHYNDYALDYGNWQWAELVGAAPKRRNALAQQNWRWY